MHSRLGSIICTAPTNFAVDNIASRIDSICQQIIDSANRNRRNCEREIQHANIDNYNNIIVVRGYDIKEEVRNFEAYLAPTPRPQKAELPATEPSTRWTLHLSLAYWLLLAIASPAVGTPQGSEHKKLWKIRHSKDPKLCWLRQIASGQISWAEYMNRSSREEDILHCFGIVLDDVDILCLTPAATEKHSYYREWKTERARGVLVDEAGNIQKADLYTVWGNTLLPCFLCGDIQQTPPITLTIRERDEKGFHNIYCHNGRISPLFSFQVMGWPVYTLKIQLRMARGLFDIVSGVLYGHSKVQYADSCDIHNIRYSPGVSFQQYMQGKFPSLKPPAEGKLAPIFLHCPDTVATVDNGRGSMRCAEQVSIALKLIRDMVEATTISPGQITCLTPYTANIDEIEQQLRSPEYKLLSCMPKPETVDSFQGQEADIVVVIMGTTGPTPGPGFTKEKTRLSVLLTRHRSGLLIVGDINVAGVVLHGNDFAKKEGSNASTRLKANGKHAKLARGPASPLLQLHSALVIAGRVVSY